MFEPSPCRQTPVRLPRPRPGSRSSAGHVDLEHTEKRRPAARKPEEALEAQRQVKVAARVEAPLGEGVEPGEPPLTQGQPGGGIAPDDDVGLVDEDGRTSQRVAFALTSHVRPTSPRRIWKVASNPGSAPRYRSGSEENALFDTPRARCSVSEIDAIDGGNVSGGHGQRQARARELLPANSINEKMREVRIRDTLRGELRSLEPRDPPRVGIYACGPTVYSRIHIGNARPYVVFMLLRRFLAALGYEPRLVINVTDINDKIYAAAREAGEALGGVRGADDGGLRRGHRPARPWPSRTTSPWPRRPSPRSSG